MCKKFFNENQGCYASGHGTRSENFDTKWCYVTNFFKFNTNDYSESARRLCASALIADWYKKKKNCYLQNKNVYLKEKPSEILLILGNVCPSVRLSQGFKELNVNHKRDLGVIELGFGKSCRRPTTQVSCTTIKIVDFATIVTPIGFFQKDSKLIIKSSERLFGPWKNLWSIAPNHEGS